VQVPRLMRAYMFEEGYGNHYQACATVADAPPGRGLDVCRSCPTCTAFCPNGIEIHDRLSSLMAMNLTETQVG
jgi:succinate dehydrogenase/fumarate reductase-like Fe-S protein